MNTTKLTRALGKAKLFVIRHKNDIMFGVGMAADAVGTGLMVKGAVDSAETFKSHKARMEAAETKEEKRAVLKETVGTGVKKMGVGAAVKLTGDVLVVCSKVGDKKIIAGLGASVAALSAEHAKVKKHVMDEFGEEKWEEFTEASPKEKEEVNEETGETEVKVDTADLAEKSMPYMKIFDGANSTSWERSPYANKKFLEDLQRWCNNRLQAQGYLFFNDVLKDLGMDIVKTGYTAGWLYDDDHMDYVDFGLGDKINQRFMFGSEPVAILKFNCRPDIMTGMVCEAY